MFQNLRYFFHAVPIVFRTGGILQSLIWGISDERETATHQIYLFTDVAIQPHFLLRGWWWVLFIIQPIHRSIKLHYLWISWAVWYVHNLKEMPGPTIPCGLACGADGGLCESRISWLVVSSMSSMSAVHRCTFSVKLPSKIKVFAVLRSTRYLLLSNYTSESKICGAEVFFFFCRCERDLIAVAHAILTIQTKNKASGVAWEQVTEAPTTPFQWVDTVGCSM